MKLGVTLVAAVVIFAVALAIRTAQTDRTCVVLRDLIGRSGATLGQKGSPGYAYYHDHPDELSAARKQNREFLDSLPCR